MKLNSAISFLLVSILLLTVAAVTGVLLSPTSAIADGGTNPPPVLVGGDTLDTGTRSTTPPDTLQPSDVTGVSISTLDLLLTILSIL